MLDKLSELTNGDKARMNIYIATYKEGIADNIISLQEALKKKDLEIIKHIVHQSKPLFTMLGFTTIYDLAQEIEVRIELNKNKTETLHKTKLLISKMSKSLESLVEFG